MLDAAPPAAILESPVIVVTARALDDPASDRAHSVERIDGQRLRNAPTTRIDEILKQAAGLQLFRRSDSRSGHPTSQGVTMRALGGNASSRAILMLDGIPQADPFGGWVNWPAYDPAAIADVRVIRGGGSVANGPGALAGSIEMTSSLAEGISAGVEGGSRSSLEGRLRTGAELGSGRLSLSAHGSRGDGFIPITRSTRGPADEPADYREGSARLLYVAPVTGPTELQAAASGFLDRRSRGLDFTGNRTVGADASLRLVGRGRWPWSLLGYAQWRKFQSSFAGVDDGRTQAERVALQDSVPSRAFGGSAEIRPPVGEGIELRLGADSRLSVGETRELFFFVDSEPTRRRIAGGETLTAGAFAEATADIGALTLSGGARLDHWTIFDGKLLERVIATDEVLRDERSGSRSGWQPTARAGAVVRINDRWSLRSAAYLGWRMPTLNELFRPFRAGSDATAANPLLDPERLSGAELGLSYRRDGLSLSATAFANRLKDAIANVTLGAGPGVFPGVGFVAEGGEFRQRRNVDAIRVRGIEFAGDWRHGPWSAHGGLSLLDPEVKSVGAASQLNGLLPAQTPRLAASAGVSWNRDRRALSLLFRHVSGQFEDDRNLQKLPAATTFDAFAGWPLTERLQLVALAENLLDETVVAGIGGDGSVERAQPRTLWLGLRFGR